MASSPPPRRRETLTSLQLQRASDQLQEAIQSARRGRSTFGGSSHATSLSLLSELSSDEEEEENVDQENQPLEANKMINLSEMEKPTPEQKLRRFMADSMGSTGRRVGASLSLKDLLASPLRPARTQSVESDLKLQIAGENASATMLSDTPVVEKAGSIVTKKLFEDEKVENDARKGLAVLQQEVEAQARSNRAAQEQLREAVRRIEMFVEHVSGCAGDDDVVDHDVLDVGTLERFANGWMVTLEKWEADRGEENKREYEDKLSHLEDTMQFRIQELEQVHATRTSEMELSARKDREVLEDVITKKAEEARKLYEVVESMKTVALEEEKIHTSALQEYLTLSNRLRMENEDLRAQLLRHNTQECSTATETAAAESNETDLLNLLAQLKQSELRELQWEMVFEEQSQATRQAEERLGMLLEDLNCSASPQLGVHSKFAAPQSAPDNRRSSLSSSNGASSELVIYQQRIELLEDQLRDVKEQIQCDHHQFLYEQQKWDLEKKHMGHDVEEVHSVSVKVLKLLLIREKLLKRQEIKSQKRLDKLKLDEMDLRAQQNVIHSCVETLLQECGVALLYVRELALNSASKPLPVKPIKLVRVIKRLKTLQQEYADRFRCSASSHHSSAATTPTCTR